MKIGLVSLLIFSFIFCSFVRSKDKPDGLWTAERSADGRYFAFGGDDSTIWIYNGNDYTFHSSVKTNSMVKGMSWHPRKNLLAIATMKGVQFLNMDNGELSTLTGISAGGRGIGWNYNGELLALADGYGVLQIMDQQGNVLRSIPKHNRKSYLSLDWHPQKNIIVTGGDEIILFDTSGKRLQTIQVREQHTGVLTVKWHPSGEFFASGDYGHENEGKPTLLQYWRADGTKLKELLGHHKEIRNLRWSTDGKWLATAADALRIWSESGALLWEGASPENLWGIAWSLDNKYIVTSCFSKGLITLWDNRARPLKVLSK